MVTTSSALFTAGKSRSNILEDASIDDIGSLALPAGSVTAPASRVAAPSSSDAPAPSEVASDGGDVKPQGGEGATKKKRKLKRQRSDSDSDLDNAEEEAKAAAAAAAEREAREALRKRKAITETLEALDSFLKISKSVVNSVLAGMSGGQAKGDEQLRAAITNGSSTFIRSYADLTHFDIAPKFQNLKLYQQCGVHWLSLLHSVENANGILADEMGLGKTAQTGVFLSYLYNIEHSVDPSDFIARLKTETSGGKRSSLILVPSSVLDNWCKELRRWAPNLKDHIVKYHGAPAVRFQTACDVLEDVSKGSFVILVSTMATVSSKEDVRLLRGLREFEYMIVDEAHSLKNSETIAYRRLSGSFNIRHRLLLTGTPVQNKQSELGNLLQFAMPETFEQSRITAAIEHLVGHYEDTVAEFPELAALVEPAEIEAYQKAQPVSTPTAKTPAKRGRKPRTAAEAAVVFAQGIKGAIEAEAKQSGDSGDATTSVDAASMQADSGNVVSSTVSAGSADVESATGTQQSHGPPSDRSSSSASLTIGVNQTIYHVDTSDIRHPTTFMPLSRASSQLSESASDRSEVNPGDGAPANPASVKLESQRSVANESAADVKSELKLESDSTQDATLGIYATPSDSESAGPDSPDTSIEPSIRALQRLVAPFILRRRKRTVMHELPEKHTFVVRCKMTGIQRELYLKEVDSKIEQHRDALGQKHKVSETEVRSICNGSSRDYALGQRDDFLVKSLIFRMRRICNHPLLVRGAYYKEDLLQKIVKYYATKVEGFKENTLERVDKELRTWSDFEMHRSLQTLIGAEPRFERYLIPKEEFMASVKVIELFKIIERVERAKRKALVFSQFTMYLDLIEECLRLNKPHVAYLRLDGGYNPALRTDVVERFSTDDGITLLLISTKAGGIGLNLTVASTVVLMDQDWNPHNDAQAEDRCHRIGQTQPVEVYKLLCENTIEEYVMQCCQRKLMLDGAFGGKASEGEEGEPPQ
ncbi:SWI2/SNF2-containing protein [Babesia caballi]|uniref:SWI2/SNF2-containing protein n=1 Tax=Babesia caballi TaxID=5871 RepID=A0AAV4LPI8_BABCB|nr:SWI2/SNF2-containing protein [Babesia caballi]